MVWPSGNHPTRNVDLADQRHHDMRSFRKTLVMGWTVEEAEGAAREWIMWRHLSSQAAIAAILTRILTHLNRDHLAL